MRTLLPARRLKSLEDADRGSDVLRERRLRLPSAVPLLELTAARNLRNSHAKCVTPPEQDCFNSYANQSVSLLLNPLQLTKERNSMQPCGEARAQLRRASICGIRAAFLTFVLATPALSQTALTPPAKPVSLSGPRFGVTFLNDSIVRKLADEYDEDIGSLVTQFGWQFEKQFQTSDGGPSLITEWVVLAGGVEQGVFLPSLSWLVGLRTMNGIEVGVGPNVTPAGAALVGAVGITFRAGGVNVPVNLAVVPSTLKRETYSGPPSYNVTEVRETGIRVSLLFGFNTQR
jgi:hypothetical protein